MVVVSVLLPYSMWTLSFRMVVYIPCHCKVEAHAVPLHFYRVTERRLPLVLRDLRFINTAESVKKIRRNSGVGLDAFYLIWPQAYGEQETTNETGSYRLMYLDSWFLS